MNLPPGVTQNDIDNHYGAEAEVCSECGYPDCRCEEPSVMVEMLARGYAGQYKAGPTEVAARLLRGLREQALKGGFNGTIAKRAINIIERRANE